MARLTLTESRFGQQLDSMADNIVHMGIFCGIAWAEYIHGSWEYRQLPLLLGGVSMVANGFSLCFVNRVQYLKSKPMHWNRLSGMQRSRLDLILGNVANRDFSVVVLLFACFGILSWFLWLGAVGTSFFALIMAWNLRRPSLPSHF